MPTALDDSTLIRRYLLRRLDEAHHSRVEQRLLEDAAFFEQVELVEDELINAAASDRIPSEEREAVLAFLDSPGRQRQLHLVRELMTRSPVRVRPDAKGRATPPVYFPDVAREVAAHRQTIVRERPWWIGVAVAASLVMSVVSGVSVWWQTGVLRRDLGNAIAQTRDELVAAAATRGTPSAGDDQAFLLAPDTSTREATAQPQIPILAVLTTGRVVLRFEPGQAGASARLHAIVQRLDGSQIWGGDMRPPDGSSQYATVTIPATLLPPEDYIVRLSAETGESVADYRFRVARP